MPILEDCLDSLRRAVDRIDHEVIVVDNKSSDNSPSVAATCFPNQTVLTNPVNKGFAAACNQGAAAASGEYLLFLNPDVQVDKDGIERLLAVFAHRDRIGLAGGRMRYPDGTFQPTCRRFPTLQNLFFSRGSLLTRLPGMSRSGKGHHYRYTLPDYPQTTIVDAVAGTMAMVRRDVFEQVNGYDPRFFLYLEDTDLSLRLDRQGFANVFVPAAGGTHYWQQGSNSGYLKRNWYHHCSVWRYFRKHRPGTSNMMLLLLLLVVNFLLGLVIPRSKRHL